MTELEIIKLLLEELEGQATHLRVSRGYGVGHPHWEERVGKQMLGDTPYAPEEESKETTQEFKKVKVSRVFKK